MNNNESTKAEEYRCRADEYERKAQECRDEQARNTYEDVARKWREMAESFDARSNLARRVATAIAQTPEAGPKPEA